MEFGINFKHSYHLTKKIPINAEAISPTESDALFHRSTFFKKHAKLHNNQTNKQYFITFLSFSIIHSSNIYSITCAA